MSIHSFNLVPQNIEPAQYMKVTSHMRRDTLLWYLNDKIPPSKNQ